MSRALLLAVLVLAAATAARAQAGATPDGASPTPPPLPTDHAAEILYDPAVMAAARRRLAAEHGGETYSLLVANIAEHSLTGGDGYRWEGQAWVGGDINRFVIKSEGGGGDRGGVGRAEIQGLYSRAVGPYFNLQAGLRQDLRPHPSRAYATVGFEGLAPYWFEVAGALFLSTRGELLGRLEGYVDQRITQRLILQPRAELNLAAREVREAGTAAGISDVELALRLRYELSRRFAPYVGVSYDRKFGAAADFARQAGERAEDTRIVAGARAWF